MLFEIRPYNQNDYLQIAAVLASAKPQASTSAELLQYRDQTRPSFCQFARFVAVKDKSIIGFSFYTQYADMFEPNAFWIDVCVSPAHQKQGVGSRLFDQLRQSLHANPLFTFRTQIQEDHLPGIRFAESRGFKEFGRRWESILDVTTFDKNPWLKTQAQLDAQNIQIIPYPDLATDPERDRKVYQLQTELDQDVPMLVPTTAMTFDQFANQILDNPSFVAEGLLIAVHGNEYVGMSSLFAVDDQSLVIDLTGTKKEYRRRGIAMALKIQGVLFAQRQEYKSITVHNDTMNEGMLAINKRLGFVRHPALIQYAKDFKPTENKELI